MKDETFQKIDRVVKRFDDFEPKWYLFWAALSAVGTFTIGTSWVWILVYLLLADASNDRNKARRRAFEWQENSNEWRRLYFNQKANLQRLLDAIDEAVTDDVGH